MGSMCNKWLLTVFVFNCSITPAWSKSLGATLGFITESGQINSNWWQSFLSLSALLVPLDILLTIVLVYYFGKRLKRQ